MSDIVPARLRSMFIGFSGGVYAVASIVGPLIGDAFTDSVTWRWAFYINIPICAITIIVVAFFLDLPIPKGNMKQKLKRVDFFGGITLICFTVCLVLAFTWGGNQYEWSSPAVIVTLVLSVLFLIAFIYVESKVAKESIIPGRILNRNVILANINSFFSGAMLMVSIYYLPIYYQIVKNGSATNAGLELLPLLLGAVLCNFITDAITTKTSNYRFLNVIAGIFQILRVSLLNSLFRVDLTRVGEILYIFFIVMRLGFCIQNNVIISQAVTNVEDVAISASLIYLPLVLGGMVELAIQGAIFNNHLAHLLTELIPNTDPRMIFSSVESIKTLSMMYLVLVFQAYIESFKKLFLSMIPYAVISFISSVFLKHISLKENPYGP